LVVPDGWFLNPVKVEWSNRRKDWPWLIAHDDTGNITDAPVTSSGLSVDRVLCPPTRAHAFEVRRKNLNHLARGAVVFVITVAGGVPQSNFSR
jgi:hypothetical protein